MKLLQSSLRLLFHSGEEPSLWKHCNASTSNSDLQTTANETDEWSRQSMMQLDVAETRNKEISISFSRRFLISWVPLLTIADKEMEGITSAKILGVTISNDLTWTQHEGYVHSKANRRLPFLCMLKRVGACRRDLLTFCKTSVKCVREYAFPLCVTQASQWSRSTS